jgi:hypothetical protein
MSSISNVGRGDAALRVLIAVVLVAASLSGAVSSGWAVGAWIVAAIMVITAAVRFCPAYALFGIDTSRSGGTPTGKAV